MLKRKVIKNFYPYDFDIILKHILTLHGHIHDSVVNAGSFMQKIGHTISATVGNDHLTEDVFVLDICVDEQITINRVGL